jgi:hypothetical protein
MIKSMKSTILSACFVSLASIGQAHAADTGTSEFTIQGTAQPVCDLSPPAAQTQDNVNVEGTSITVTNLINQNDATIQPFTATIKFDQVMCNYSAYVTIASANGGLQPVNAPNTAVDGSGEFLTHVDYTVNATWGSVTLPQLNTASGLNTVQELASGPNQADLIVTIATPGSAMPLAQAEYLDTLTIQIGLQM